MIADDHGIMREGLRKLLELDDNLEVVGEADNGIQAIALAKKLRPNIVLMDIKMPLLDGRHDPGPGAIPQESPRSI